MGNKATLKVHINKEHFLKVLHTKKCSIRQLGEAYNEIGRTEKNRHSKGSPCDEGSLLFMSLIRQPVEAIQAPSYSQVVSWPGTMVAI